MRLNKFHDLISAGLLLLLLLLPSPPVPPPISLSFQPPPTGRRCPRKRSGSTPISTSTQRPSASAPRCRTGRSGRATTSAATPTTPRRSGSACAATTTDSVYFPFRPNLAHQSSPSTCRRWAGGALRERLLGQGRRRGRRGRRRAGGEGGGQPPSARLRPHEPGRGRGPKGPPRAPGARERRRRGGPLASAAAPDRARTPTRLPAPAQPPALAHTQGLLSSLSTPFLLRESSGQWQGPGSRGGAKEGPGTWEPVPIQSRLQILDLLGGSENMVLKGLARLGLATHNGRLIAQVNPAPPIPFGHRAGGRVQTRVLVGPPPTLGTLPPAFLVQTTDAEASSSGAEEMGGVEAFAIPRPLCACPRRPRHQRHPRRLPKSPSLPPLVQCPLAPVGRKARPFLEGDGVTQSSSIDEADAESDA